MSNLSDHAATRHTPALPLMAGATTLGKLFSQRVRINPHAIAVIEPGANDRSLTYLRLNERVNRLANALLSRGLQRGDRIALLSRNTTAYVEIELAAAKLGIIVAALNWRLAGPELIHCITLAEPTLLLVAPDYIDSVTSLGIELAPVIALDDAYDALIDAALSSEPDATVDSEDGLVIIYTSGTTGFPKGAVISHRAMIARALVYASEFSLKPDGTFVAWAPFFHMASTDHALATLLRGGTVAIVDGYEPDLLCESIERFSLSWMILIPGMLDAFLEVLRVREPRVKGIEVIGAMPDLVSPQHIGEISDRLQAPYANTFGATETGLPPATASLFPIGEIPTDLAKQQSAFCEIKLVDEEDREVDVDVPGECAIRGPTLFSGYWRAPDVNTKDFRGGWFHMGDVFARRDDGRLAFMDRSKYLIKSGGESIFPAEIERVLLSESRVDDAVVVRRADAQWGEVVVAVVARNDTSLTEDDLTQRCRAQLAGYKTPRIIRFVEFDALPRSTTGKIKRHEVEQWFHDDGK